MTAHEALFVLPDSSSKGTSATDARLALAGLLAPTGTGVRAGVLYEGAQSLVAGTSGMEYVVDSFAAVVVRLDSVGPYLLANRGVVTVGTDVGPASGARYDLVWVRQGDVEQGDVSSAAGVGVTVGLSSATPAPPVSEVPDGALVLGRARVEAGAGSTDSAAVVIENVFPFTNVRGAAVPVRDQSELEGLYKYVGAKALRLDLDAEVVCNGADWVTAGFNGATPYATATSAGSQTISSPSTSGVNLQTTSTQGGLTQSGGVFTVPVAGWYAVAATLLLGTPGSPVEGTTVTVRVDAAGQNVAFNQPPAATDTHTVSVSGETFLQAGDQVEFRLGQSSSAVRLLSSSTAYNRVSVRFIGS